MKGNGAVNCTLALAIPIRVTRKGVSTNPTYLPKPATPDSRNALFRVHERARQRPKEGYFEAVEHIGVFVSAPCQKANESYVDDEEYPRQDRRPGEYEVEDLRGYQSAGL